MKRLLLPAIGVFVSSIFLLRVSPINAQDRDGDSASAVAADAAAKEKEKHKYDKLEGGVLSSQGSYSGEAAVDSIDPSADIGGKADQYVSPVVGGVKREGSACISTVTNTSETATFSVVYVVEEYAKDGAMASRNSFSDTLNPKQSVSRRVSCSKGSNIAVVLKSGRKTKEIEKKD